MVLCECLNREVVSQVQVRAWPQFGWAAAAMLLFVSAACAVAAPSLTAAPAPSSDLPTVVPTEPTETKAIELPILESGVPPTPEAGVLRILEAGMLPTETPQAA